MKFTSLGDDEKIKPTKAQATFMYGARAGEKSIAKLGETNRFTKELLRMAEASAKQGEAFLIPEDLNRLDAGRDFAEVKRFANMSFPIMVNLKEYASGNVETIEQKVERLF